MMWYNDCSIMMDNISDVLRSLMDGARQVMRHWLVQRQVVVLILMMNVVMVGTFDKVIDLFHMSLSLMLLSIVAVARLTVTGEAVELREELILRVEPGHLVARFLLSQTVLH